MANISVYIPTFDVSLNDILAATLPTDVDDVASGYVATYETSLSLSEETGQVSNMFRFIVEGETITLSASQLSLAAASTFDVSNATWVAGANKSGYFSQKLGDEYLAHIAEEELGSVYLIGAFDNVAQVVNSIQKSDVLDAINADQALNETPHTIPFMSYPTHDVTPSGLWSVYSTVLEDAPGRFEGDEKQGQSLSLLIAGDTIYMKVNIKSPELDATIAGNGPAGYTPVKPADRCYRLKINIVA